MREKSRFFSFLLSLALCLFLSSLMACSGSKPSSGSSFDEASSAAPDSELEESKQAAELAVETAPGYRRLGYARQVVAAWASHVLGEGKVAFYSHEVGNAASEALAHSLGVVQYAVVTTYESKATAG